MNEPNEKAGRRYRERAFFHKNDQKHIYMVEYVPDDAAKLQHGVILCKPIWGERIRTHRIYTNLARSLAGAGMHVITCDYYGDGNSAGSSLELDVGGMADDIVAMSLYMNQKFVLERFTLVGMLIGANAARLSGNRIGNLKKMILIQPVLNPIEHLEAALRSNLSTQMVVHKKVLKDRNTLISEIKNGIPVNVDGFMLSKRLWESYERISPMKDQQVEYAGDTIIISLKKKASKGNDYTQLKPSMHITKIIDIEQEFVWTDWKVYKPKPAILFQTLKNEIGGINAN